MPAYDADLDRLAAEIARAPWWQWQPGMLARTRKMSGWASYPWSPERFQDGDIPDLHHAPTLKAVLALALSHGGVAAPVKPSALLTEAYPYAQWDDSDPAVTVGRANQIRVEVYWDDGRYRAVARHAPTGTTGSGLDTRPALAVQLAHENLREKLDHDYRKCKDQSERWGKR